MYVTGVSSLRHVLSEGCREKKYIDNIKTCTYIYMGFPEKKTISTADDRTAWRKMSCAVSAANIRTNDAE